MKHSLLDRYSDRDSFIHRLDPRTKFLFTLFFILAVVITPSSGWSVFLFYLSTITGLILFSRVPIYYVFKSSLYILPFAGVVAISVPFVKQGDIAWSFHLLSQQISVTYTGLTIFGSLLTKAWLSALSLILLTSTTHVTELLKGLEQLRLPQVMTMILSFMYRYIFVLTDEVIRMKQARDSRNFGGKRLWQIKTIGNMIGTLFIRSYEQAERVYSAMLARGYDGQTRTLKQLKFEMIDGLFGIGMGVIFVIANWMVFFVKWI